jgi:tetratricopeptide (TPR) repeat protein
MSEDLDIPRDPFGTDAMVDALRVFCQKQGFEIPRQWLVHPDDCLITHWTSYWKSKNDDDAPYGYWNAEWIRIYSALGYPEKALDLYPIAKADEEGCGGMFMSELYMKYIGEAFLKKTEYDKAISCFEKADNYGYEGLGDCYVAKGDKQRAAANYKKCLSLDYYDGKNRVEKKLKELGY